MDDLVLLLDNPLRDKTYPGAHNNEIAGPGIIEQATSFLHSPR
jgi:hypothetical protein